MASLKDNKIETIVEMAMVTVTAIVMVTVMTVAMVSESSTDMGSVMVMAKADTQSISV